MELEKNYASCEEKAWLFCLYTREVQNYTKYKKSTIYKWLHVAFGIKIHTMMLLDPFMASLKSKTSSIDPYIKGEV